MTNYEKIICKMEGAFIYYCVLTTDIAH